MLRDFDVTMRNMGFQAFASMDNPTNETLTQEFLTTVKVEYERPKHKTASEGHIRFKLGEKEYTFSFFALCDIYDFEKKPLVKFPTFEEAD